MYSWTFRVRRYAVMCTCAPIANPPNMAQLGGTPTIPASYIRVRAVVWVCGRRQTHKQTLVTNIHFANDSGEI